MSFPFAVGLAWISLLIFVASLPSSPFGAPGSTNFTTTVCSTGPGNNSYVSYNVSQYNETKLVLSCPGETGRSAYWMRADGSVLCTGRNCTVNFNRRLTNDDSGDYLCKTSVENGTDYQFVHINVLAPPMLSRIVYCSEEDQCTLAQNTDIYPQTPYHINVTYTGNGPFSIEWYHNGSIFNCNSTKYCSRIQYGSMYQTLILESGSLEDTMKMSGLYGAVVRNPYGTNESLIRLYYSCKPDPPRRSEITVSLQEGSTLNESCGVTMQSAQWMYACITKNHSATFADLWNDSDSCVICNSANDVGQECANQFNSNITSITVNRLEDDGCPPVQMMNFMKNNVTVRDDDGAMIICAYSATSDDDIKPYTFIHVKISRPPNSHSSQVSVTVSSTVVCLIITLAVVLTVASCVVLRKKKYQYRDRRRTLIQEYENARSPERPDEHGEQQSLIEEQYINDYGTESVLEVFPGELSSQEPAANVIIN